MTRAQRARAYGSLLQATMIMYVRTSTWVKHRTYNKLMSTSPSQFTNVGFRFLLPAIDCSLFGVYLYSTSEGLSYTMAFKMYFQTPQGPLWVGRGHFYESGGLGLVFRLGEGLMNALKHVSVAVFFDSALKSQTDLRGPTP